MSAKQKSACNPKIHGFLALSLILVCFGASASAQVTTATADASDTSYYIGYYGNANMAGVPDGTVTIVNPGSTNSDVCANIYVFTSDQEMVECCSCSLTPSGMLQLSLDNNLTSNPLANSTKVPLPTAGALKVVASSGCGPGNAGTAYRPYGSLRIWDTHVRETVGGTTPLFTVTETPFPQASLDDGGTELSKLQDACFAIQQLGSGSGICSCPFSLD